MSEKELIQALRDLIDRDAPPALEARLVAQEIVRRDAWRLRILAGLSIVFWIVGIAGIFVVFFSLRNYLIVTSGGIELLATDPSLRMAIFSWERTVNHSLEVSMGCLVAWMLGSLCTIWLISSSRRATLSQINLSLLRLSEEMKQLRQPPGESNVEVHEPTTTTSCVLPTPARPGPPWMRRKAFWAVAVVVLVVIVPLSSREVQVKLEWVIHHVQVRWNPFSKNVSSCAPYAAVRWRDSVPEVELMGTWYELVSLDDIPAAEIVSFCKKTKGKFWRKPFEEDLVVVLQQMGKQGHFDMETGPLTVRRLDTGETLVLTNVAWTDANRQAILLTALAAWKANGEKDPRDDPSYR